ncbi:bifunctional sugar-1-phosphate nucleotidylyltransferase/acetyltransferase [Deltaproteobacteria bacterium TL4]
MKAVILAAYCSNRLHPFSSTRAKPMIRVAGKYILESSIRYLKESGIHQILIVVNHKRDMIQDYFSFGEKLGVNIEYIVQEPTEGIGHALKLCEPFLSNHEHFLLAYGDVLSNGNIFSNALTAFSKVGKDIAVVTLPRSSQEFGNVYLDHKMKIMKLVEKPQVGYANYVFSGVFVLSRHIFALLDQNRNDIEQCYQNIIHQQKGLQATLWEKGWIDIIYPWHILEANTMIMDSWKEAIIDSTVSMRGQVHLEGPVVIEKNVTIESGTILKGPCYIGENSYIGNNTLIRSYSALGPNSIVGYGSELKNCVLFGEANIGRLSFIGDSVIGENVHLGSGLTTVNHHHDFSTIICTLDDVPVDTGLSKVGVFMGDHVCIGARHTFAPGTVVPADKHIPDNISLS